MAKVKNIVNIHETVTLNAAEIIFNVADNNENATVDWEERFFDSTTLEIWTGSGGTGTQLILDTDYTVSNENTQLSAATGKPIFGVVNIINATYYNTDLYIPASTLGLYGDFLTAEDPNRLQEQIDQIIGGTAQAVLGQEFTLPVYADYSKYGLLPFSFDSISKAQYADYYALVGDMYDSQHVAAGQPSLIGTDNFYYSPVPQQYAKAGLPDLNFDNTNIVGSPSYIVLNINNENIPNFRNGTPFKLDLISGSLPTGLSNGTTYYLRGTGTSYFICATEEDAIGGVYIPYTDSGSGTFRLTQEGLNLDDAFQGHKVELLSHPTSATTSPATILKGSATSASGNSYSTGSDSRLVDDGINGTPRTSNQTRGDEYFTYKYIKVQYVVPYEGTPVSEFVYKWERGTSTAWQNQTLTVNHGLDASLTDLNIEVELYIDSVGIWQRVFDIGYNPSSSPSSTETWGYSVDEVDNNNINLLTGFNGILTIKNNNSNKVEALYNGISGNIRMSITKKVPELLTIDQGAYTNRQITVTDGGSVTLIGQKTIVLVDTTAGDVNFSVDGYDTSYPAGQELVVKNIGTANECTITNNIGGWLKDATVPFGQSARAEIVSDELTEGDFFFVWDVDSDIGFENGFSNSDASNRPVLIVMKNRCCEIQGLLAIGTPQATCFTIPVEIRNGKNGTSSYTIIQNNVALRANIRVGGLVDVANSTSAAAYLDGITWSVGI